MKELLLICLIERLNSDFENYYHESTVGVLFVNVALSGIYLESIKIRPECLTRPFS